MSDPMQAGSHKSCPVQLDPEAFEAFARGQGWDSDTIRLLCQPKLPSGPFFIANGKGFGKWVVIVEAVK